MSGVSIRARQPLNEQKRKAMAEWRLQGKTAGVHNLRPLLCGLRRAAGVAVTGSWAGQIIPAVSSRRRQLQLQDAQQTECVKDVARGCQTRRDIDILASRAGAAFNQPKAASDCY